MAPKRFAGTTNYQTSTRNISEERITEQRRGGSLNFPSLDFISVINLLSVALYILCILEL
jgi:hypothetical protein